MPESPWALAASTRPTSDTLSPVTRPQLVYTTFEGATSSIWIAPIATLPRARLLATIDQQPGFGARGRVSPKGDVIAYLALPVGSRDPASQGELWVLSTLGGSPRTISGGFDMLSPPLWSPDGTRVALRQVSDGDIGFTFVAIDVTSGAMTTLAANDDALSGQPIGWAGDAFYYSTITPRGTDVYRVDGASASTLAFHASDGIARDFRISPTEDRLLYAEMSPGDPAPRSVVISLSGQPQPERLSGAFSSVWSGGTITAGTTQSSLPQQHEGVSTLQQTLGSAPLPANTLMAPLAWSQDNRYLAAQLLNGDTPSRATASALVVLSPGGASPAIVAPGGYAEFAGWAQ